MPSNYPIIEPLSFLLHTESCEKIKRSNSRNLTCNFLVVLVAPAKVSFRAITSHIVLLLPPASMLHRDAFCTLPFTNTKPIKIEKLSDNRKFRKIY